MHPRWRATNSGVGGGEEHGEAVADRRAGRTRTSLAGGGETRNTHQQRPERKTTNKKSGSIKNRTRTYELGGGATRGGTANAGKAGASKTAAAAHMGADGGGGTIGDRGSNNNT